MKNKIITLIATMVFIPSIAYAQIDNPQLIFKQFQLQTQSTPQPSRTITMVGEVDEKMAIETINELKSLNLSSNEEIEIDITSPGGSVYDGLAIIDAMNASKSPIKTVCQGYCMSMAGVILASGTHGHRFAMPMATILLHQVSSECKGTISQINNDLQESKRLQDLMTSVLQSKTGLSKDKLNEIMNHDNYMSPTEAKSFNIIDGIVGK
jgi:ATP-dependent Clp protease protease subunit